MRLCSVISETIFISDPHAGHESGSTSKRRLSNRAQLAREAFGAVQALEQAAAEDLFHEPRVEVRELQESSACTRGWKLAA